MGRPTDDDSLFPACGFLIMDGRSLARWATRNATNSARTNEHKCMGVLAGRERTDGRTDGWTQVHHHHHHRKGHHSRMRTKQCTMSQCAHSKCTTAVLRFLPLSICDLELEKAPLPKPKEGGKGHCVTAFPSKSQTGYKVLLHRRAQRDTQR